jgi:molybdopterin/thiamine biosynthesis adenylyltransferase
VADVLQLDTEEDRFARFRLISWWDQERLANARVVVIGAGALGNEIIKNLALLGIGRVFVADLDRVANSNLSRSVLFREADCGKPKVEVVAERARDIYPAIRVEPFFGNIVYDLGLGVYRWADVILGGLDNREARVAINQAAAKAGKTWIDGAIERLDGVARVFTPATGPCYECTMSAVDWQMLEARRSCALLTRQEMEQGKVPTTPTTASVIAGIQCQEAVKLLHGMDVLAGQGFVFDGRNHESYRLTYTRLPDCPAHEGYAPVAVVPASVQTTQAGTFLDQVRSELGRSAVIETNQDLLAGLTCSTCNEEEPLFSSLGKVTEDRGRCPRCQEHRAPLIYHSIDGTNSAIAERTLGELGVPPWDVLVGRAGQTQRFYEFQGDRAAVLGCLAETRT